MTTEYETNRIVNIDGVNYKISEIAEQCRNAISYIRDILLFLEKVDTYQNLPVEISQFVYKHKIRIKCLIPQIKFNEDLQRNWTNLANAISDFNITRGKRKLDFLLEICQYSTWLYEWIADQVIKANPGRFKSSSDG